MSRREISHLHGDGPVRVLPQREPLQSTRHALQQSATHPAAAATHGGHAPAQAGELAHVQYGLRLVNTRVLPATTQPLAYAAAHACVPHTRRYPEM